MNKTLKLYKKDLINFSNGNIFIYPYNDKLIIINESLQKMIIVPNESQIDMSIKFDVGFVLGFVPFKLKQSEVILELNEENKTLISKYKKTVETTWYDTDMSLIKYHLPILKNICDNKYIYENILELNNKIELQYIAVNNFYSTAFELDNDNNFLYKNLTDNDYKLITRKAEIVEADSLVFSNFKSKKGDEFNVVKYFFNVGTSSEQGATYLEICNNNILVKSYDTKMIKFYKSFIYFMKKLETLVSVDITNCLEYYTELEPEIGVRITELLSNSTIINSDIYVRISKNELKIIDSYGIEIFKTDYTSNVDIENYFDFKYKLWKVLMANKSNITTIKKYMNDDNDVNYFLVKLSTGIDILIKI